MWVLGTMPEVQEVPSELVEERTGVIGSVYDDAHDGVEV
jgi:hypothetical protein